jgi:hypothetical protein
MVSPSAPMTRRPRKGMRERWLPYVLAAEIDEGTRCLLVILWELMTDAGRVSIPRDDLAGLFRVAPTLISQRFARAVNAGLLVKTGRGFIGHTAEYEAIIPTSRGCVRTHPLDAPFPHPLTTRIGQERVRRDAPQRARVTKASRVRVDDERDAGDAPPRIDPSIHLVDSTPKAGSAGVWGRAAPSNPDGTLATTEVPNGRAALPRQTRDQDFRPIEQPLLTSPIDPPPDARPDAEPQVSELGPAGTSDPPTPEELDAKDERRRAQLGYRRTGGITPSEPT